MYEGKPRENQKGELLGNERGKLQKRTKGKSHLDVPCTLYIKKWKPLWAAQRNGPVLFTRSPVQCLSLPRTHLFLFLSLSAYLSYCRLPFYSSKYNHLLFINTTYSPHTNAHAYRHVNGERNEIVFVQNFISGKIKQEQKWFRLTVKKQTTLLSSNKNYYNVHYFFVEQ